MNKEFLTGHRVVFTPSLYVIDPANGRVAASHYGGVSLAQLNEFLDGGARDLGARPLAPADSALAQAGEALGHGQLPEAVAAYRRALALGGASWPQREPAMAELAWTLMTSGEHQACADLALAEAPGMNRGPGFARVVLAGLLSANMADTTAWAVAARAKLVPLAREATAITTIARNDRFQLYQELMAGTDLAGDTVAAVQWGDRWLAEIERTKPANDDERSALDIARVDAVSMLGTPERAIAPLEASERAMPRNYNACLRLAQVLSDAKRYDEALAACDRGLARVDGPLGRTWLLETKAGAFMGKGDSAQARAVLEEARRSANQIVMASNRDNNLRRIDRLMAEAQK